MKQLFKKRRTLSASSLLLMSLFLCLFLSVGCSVIKNNAAETPNIFVNEKKDNNAEEDVMEKVSSNKISIVCTTFPQYDWVKNIMFVYEAIKLQKLEVKPITLILYGQKQKRLS